MVVRLHVACALAAGLLAWSLTAVNSASGQHTPMPSRVVELCGDLPIPVESLCNVEESLRDSFLLIERIVAMQRDGAPPEVDAAPLPDSVVLVVRERQISVEWYSTANSTDLRDGLMGLYDENRHQIHLGPALRPEPQRVWASVMAHELGHAALQQEGVGGNLRPAEACLENEARAFKIGMVAYVYATRATSSEPVVLPVDRHLASEVDLWHQFSGGERLTAGGLDDLAARHIFLHGYTIDCNWR